MTRLEIASAKLNVVFPEGKLPAIDPADPQFVLVLGGLEIRGKVNAKAARKRSTRSLGRPSRSPNSMRGATPACRMRPGPAR